MLSYFLVAICSLVASLLTFFSGFGLGTLLMPILAIFLPLPLAIIVTALVHFFQNSLKAAFLYKAIDWSLALKFGSTAILFAIGGAFLLKTLTFWPHLASYSFLGIKGQITLLKILIGILLLAIATAGIISEKLLRIKNLYLGGAISGFFGGLCGYQGAFRSIFLVNISKNAASFISTNAMISLAVDLVRLIVYGLTLNFLFKELSLPITSSALIGAAIGSLAGVMTLQKITIKFIQITIRTLLYLLALLLISGII